MKLAEITMNRDLGLMKEAIPRQDVDNAVGAYEADKATVASQTANVKRLEQLVAFRKSVRAVRRRDHRAQHRYRPADQCGQRGRGAGAVPHRLHIKLRIFVSVPQMYSRGGGSGSEYADMTPCRGAGRHFMGQIARNAGAIDPTTRTLLTEVDIDNTSGQLMPGAYAEVHLKLPAATAALVVPVTALIFRAEGLQVAVVREGNKAELVHVTQGRDFGTEVEITSGITARDSVIINTPDSLTSGAAVRVESSN